MHKFQWLNSTWTNVIQISSRQHNLEHLLAWSLVALDSFLIELRASNVASVAESFDFKLCHLTPANIWFVNGAGLQNVAFLNIQKYNGVFKSVFMMHCYPLNKSVANSTN